MCHGWCHTLNWPRRQPPSLRLFTTLLLQLSLTRCCCGGEAPHAASETRRWDNTRGERAFTHTHTERERVVAAHGLCLAHQHTETLIQAECVCVWRSKRKRGKVRKGPQSKHVVGFSVALFLILIWLFNQLLDKLFGPLSVRKWWKMLISVFKSPRRRPCFVYNPKDLQFTVKDDLKNWTY